MSMFLDIFAALLAWERPLPRFQPVVTSFRPIGITYGQAAQTTQGLMRNLIPLHRRGWGAISGGAGAKADQRGKPPAPCNCDCD